MVLAPKGFPTGREIELSKSYYSAKLVIETRAVEAQRRESLPGNVRSLNLSWALNKILRQGLHGCFISLKVFST